MATGASSAGRTVDTAKAGSAGTVGAARTSASAERGSVSSFCGTAGASAAFSGDSPLRAADSSFAFFRAARISIRYSKLQITNAKSQVNFNFQNSKALNRFGTVVVE
jgi:hypothetical protein